MAGIALFDDRAAHRFPQTVVAAAGLLFAAGALAHHSAAAFDVTKEVSIEGTVADLEDVRGDGAQLEVHRGGAGRTSSGAEDDTFPGGLRRVPAARAYGVARVAFDCSRRQTIGRIENGALVIDTIAFSRHPVGVTVGVPSGPSKHMVERLALSPDRLHLRYEFTLEDPDYLAEPASFSMQWDHRPDLQPSGVPCDPKIARRFLEDAAKP